VNRNDRTIVGLVMVAHATVHTYELSVPILVGVWLEEFRTVDVLFAEFRVTAAVMGVVVGVGYVLFGLGALPGGMLADLVGSRRLIVACLGGMAGSFLLLSVAPGVAVIAIALALWGAAASVYHPSGLSLISKGVTERGTGFAYHGMAGNLGIALGPLVTTLLLIALNWRTVTALLAAPAALGVLLALRAKIDESAAVEAGDDADPTRGDGGRDDPTGEDPRSATAVSSLPEFVSGTRALFSGAFVLVFGIVIASGLYYRGVLTFLPEILGGYAWLAPIEVAGLEMRPSRYAYVALLTVGMGGQYVGGKLTDRIDPARGIAGSFVALAVLALAFVPVVEGGIFGFAVVGVALGFALFVVQPMYQALVAQLTPAGTRGLSYGYTYLGVFGIGALGGVVAGTVLTYWSTLGLFVVLAILAAAAATVAGVLTRRGTA